MHNTHHKGIVHWVNAETCIHALMMIPRVFGMCTTGVEAHHEIVSSAASLWQASTVRNLSLLQEVACCHTWGGE